MPNNRIERDFGLAAPLRSAANPKRFIRGDNYGAKLKEALRMPPTEAVLRSLPSSLTDLDLIKSPLEAKLRRYRYLLVTGNAGY